MQQRQGCDLTGGPLLCSQGYLEGVGAELPATDRSELAESEMRDRVHQALTRK